MSTHSNKKGGAPSSSRTKLRGHNPTYLASVQKSKRGGATSKPAGSNERKQDASVNGSSRTTAVTKMGAGPSTEGGYGSGHYKANK